MNEFGNAKDADATRALAMRFVEEIEMENGV
jgi:hypothetical protein